MDHELADQTDELLKFYPLGSKAIELLTAGRSLVSRFLERPGVGAEECREYIRQVDILLNQPVTVSEGKP